jgi:hypothetical protein
MRFKETFARLTGISVPFFGVQWNPPEADRAIAKRLIAFLEDRRVLYAPSEMEVPEHCVHSIIEIRSFLTSELGKLEETSELASSLRALRGACRKFLDTVQKDGDRIIRFGFSHGWPGWVFGSALGEMRGVFGIHIAILAAKYGVNIEKDLSSILPAKDMKG